MYWKITFIFIPLLVQYTVQVLSTENIQVLIRTGYSRILLVVPVLYRITGSLIMLSQYRYEYCTRTVRTVLAICERLSADGLAQIGLMSNLMICRAVAQPDVRNESST